MTEVCEQDKVRVTGSLVVVVVTVDVELVAVAVEEDDEDVEDVVTDDVDDVPVIVSVVDVVVEVSVDVIVVNVEVVNNVIFALHPIPLTIQHHNCCSSCHVVADPILQSYVRETAGGQPRP